ncbi:XrtB/PEP-CTERM-associated transcriptional regulator EpsA [Massilia sp. DWR3-1-1]|uniref:XrtB/PEP-CTERM-associated transcriptional regulator EpsA n=1 Tax=Massilia sp. DWR3-1-1 TaxID=2804559 RepID=UPI003CF975C5
MDAVVILSAREQEYLLGAIEAAVKVRDLRQFFLWTQGQLQALLPHQLMLCVQLDGAGTLLRAEPIHAGLLDAVALRVLTHPLEGLAPRLAALFKDSERLPAITGAGRRAGDAALRQFRRPLQQLGLDHLVVHGSGAIAGTSTLFALCGWQAAPTERHAYFLSLLLPHLHLALLRVAAAEVVAGKGAVSPSAAVFLARPLSMREREILGWVREGKSNFEVGLILGISAVTVKNHLQRIYRALGVSNRTHALARCLSLQLLDAMDG